MSTAFGYLGLVLFLAMGGATAKESCQWPHEMPASKIVLVGEVHGTEEAPEFLGNLACAASNRSEKVVVALEISSSEQPIINSYLKSHGSRKDKLRFLSGKFWTRTSQDGRSSRAMFDLIERLRKLKRLGAPISVVAVDETVDESRDAGMAMHIERAANVPNATIIALLGNYHASQHKGTSRDPDYEPAGYRLSALKPLSVLFFAQSGSAWVCTPGCGVLTHERDENAASIVGYSTGPDTRPGYNATFSVRSSTASLPAVTELKISGGITGAERRQGER